VARGSWRATSEAVQYEGQGAGDYVALRYHALEVNAVLRPEAGQPVRVFVTQDGHPVAKSDKGADLLFTEDGRSYVLVDVSRMYSLVKNAKFGTHTLGLLPEGPGLGLYAYTFGSCTIASGSKE
jgi:hypothetical protein